MFKKLKDKLAEEVKSSPQRIQLFAQAAQAAVTSASSSISDITNNDLFSIGDNADSQQSQQAKTSASPLPPNKTFQDVSFMQSPAESSDFSQDLDDIPRQRRLSNSSFASDVSFRLPSYETPSMYHLQSDLEVSASEADDRGFSGGPTTLDRVTKEQLYAAYKRTQERYKKYRTQYSDLARHYKLLERENAKARSVLVETQDKALRRISELKEQCVLEQSAKAHLEKALRVEIEEKSMKIDALNTKIQCLQNNILTDTDANVDKNNENEVQLINLDSEGVNKNENSSADISNLNNKLEKMDQLLNKYKESLKSSKEKNSQLTAELQILSKELENKDKQIQELKLTETTLSEAKSKIQELCNLNEELQNKLNSFDFQKTKEQSTLELDLQRANEELAELRSKIEVFAKREEEYAISLAENKLSIHKELESKEAEIKNLKENVSGNLKEIQSLKIVIDDYKNNITALEEDKNKLSKECAEIVPLKNKIADMDTKLQDLSKKSQLFEQLKLKADEEYKCLQLQLKQETAEKLAMIDRNSYLETKNTQLSEDNNKKNMKISNLESQIQLFSNKQDVDQELALKQNENLQLVEEVSLWKQKYDKLEQEILEEREELLKLQTEIEKLLSNHELLQTQNTEFRNKIAYLSSEYSKQHNETLQQKAFIQSALQKILHELKQLKAGVAETSKESKIILQTYNESLLSMSEHMNSFNRSISSSLKDIENVTSDYNNLKADYEKLLASVAISNDENTNNSNKYDILMEEKKLLNGKLKEKEFELENITSKLENSTREYETLMDKIDLLSNEHKELSNTLTTKDETIQLLKSTVDNEKAEYSVIAEKLKISEIANQELNNAIQSFENQYQNSTEEIEQLKRHYEEKLDKIKSNYQCALKEKDEILEKMSSSEQELLGLIQKMQQLDIEKNQMHNKLTNIENENIKLKNEISELTQQHDTDIIKIKELDTELRETLKALEKSKLDQSSLEKQISQDATTYEALSHVEKDKNDLTEKLVVLEEKHKKIFEDFEEVNRKLNDAEVRIQELNILLNNKSIECESKQEQIGNLNKEIEKLTQENISLKTETANFASNIAKLETDINVIKQSHAEIESEKDHLSRVIENLESKQQDINISNEMKKDMDSQTESVDDKTEELGAVLENKWILEHRQTLSSTASLNFNKENVEELYEQYSTLKLNYDTLKDENRRFQSDIEGLQSYLTKISKENSVLNDKLRELIATSEHSPDTEQLSSDVKELRNEVLISKEKINDLQRENTLLIEENLELKDQLSSHNYSKPIIQSQMETMNDKETDLLTTKYNQLLEAHSHLEKQNMNLEHMNKSVNGNMQQLQEKNERLRLSNEKLERRLDEALVSLRHLHSLQENTELEYLRNILYEYLTGSGTHSVTLAKVLAAIVKFDDGQTRLVLQKEKERQGFLRQLGII